MCDIHRCSRAEKPNICSATFKFSSKTNCIVCVPLANVIKSANSNLVMFRLPIEHATCEPFYVRARAWIVGVWKTHFHVTLFNCKMISYRVRSLLSLSPSIRFPLNWIMIWRKLSSNKYGMRSESTNQPTTHHQPTSTNRMWQRVQIGFDTRNRKQRWATAPFDALGIGCIGFRSLRHSRNTECDGWW